MPFDPDTRIDYADDFAGPVTWEMVEAALEEVLRWHDRRADLPHALAVYWLWEMAYGEEAEYAATHPDELGAWIERWKHPLREVPR